MSWKGIKVGDKVKARWFDDPTWYEGVVAESDEKRYGRFCLKDDKGEVIGYLKYADEVKKVE